MSNQSNLLFNLRQTVTTAFGAGATFNITGSTEDGSSIELPTETSIVLKSPTQIERMTITATGGVATIVKRGLEKGNTAVENVALNKPWGDGTLAYTTALALNLFNLTDDNLLVTGKKVQFGTTDVYIWSDDGINLKFKDALNNEIDLTTISALSGADTKVAVSTNDTTPSQLEDKLTAGDGLTITKVNPAGNEVLDMDIDTTDTTIFSETQVANKIAKLNASGNVTDLINGEVGGVASETDAGLVEFATDIEAIARTATNKVLTPANIGVLTQIAILQTTRNNIDVDGVVNIPHGLTTAPKYASINMLSENTFSSQGFSDGTSNKCVYKGSIYQSSSLNQTSGNDTSSSIVYLQGGGGSSNQNVGQFGVVTFDDTNVTITWTRTSGGSLPSSSTFHITMLVHT